MTERPVPAAGRARRPGARTFAHRVLAAVRCIPPGRVATYGEVARLAGSPRAARAVGNIMRTCRDPATPCHRVIGSGGALGGYGSGGLGLKANLLRAEGLIVVGRRVRNHEDRRWSPGPQRTGAPASTTEPRTRRGRRRP